jgi:hypothetical protein
MQGTVGGLDARLVEEIKQGFRVSTCDGCLNHNDCPVT